MTDLFKSLYFDRSVYQGECGGIHEPWLTREAIVFLENFLDKTKVVLEFGSGTSTKWFAERCKFIYSVELNPQWLQIVQEKLTPLTNYSLIKTNQDTYCDIFPILQDITPDFVLVDGEFPSRLPSAVEGLRLLKPGGVIMVDDVEYEGYKPILEFLESKGLQRQGLMCTKKGTTSWWVK